MTEEARAWDTTGGGHGPADSSDQVAGSAYVAALFLTAWLYWQLHGGSVAAFSFWSDGDRRWLEIIFWSLFTKQAWTVTDVAFELGYGRFRRRYVWAYFGQTLEAPPTSLAFVYLVTNLGVVIGGTSLSFKEAPVQTMIALAILASYFSRDAVGALQAAFRKLTGQTQAEVGSPDQPTVESGSTPR